MQAPVMGNIQSGDRHAFRHTRVNIFLFQFPKDFLIAEIGRFLKLQIVLTK